MRRVIQVRQLTKRYGATAAVDHLSFDVRPGAVTGFLGPNGSGKSTTMRLILGLDRADAGHARIGGRPARAHLAALAAGNAIGRARVEEVLALTGLEQVAGKRA